MVIRKKPTAVIDPKTGLLVRKTKVFVRREGQRSSRVPSRFFKALGDLFDICRRKK